MQSQPLGQRNAFKSCLLSINNGIVLLKQPKKGLLQDKRVEFIWGQKLLLGFDVVNILFGPHQ